MVKRIGRAVQVLLVLVLAAILLCNLYMIAAKNLLHQDNPTLFGWSWAVILSGSMEPEISLDDLIVNKAQERYEVNDIITFENGGALTTHRIVRESEGGFITQGDANNSEDTTPVSPERIVGKVMFAVPKVGLVLGWMKTPAGLLTVILIGLALIEVPYLWKNRRKERGKGNEPQNV